MNKFVICLLIISIALSVNADLDEILEEHMEDCIKETGASKKEILKLLNNDFTSKDPKVQVIFLICN